MTDIEQIRRALQTIAYGTEDIEPPYRAMPPEYYRRIAVDALPALGRLAARAGEGWCFDMEKAPRDGTRFIAITKGGVQRIDQRHQVQASSAKYFWAEVPIDPYVAWCPLPPPPETNDE